VSIDLGLSLTDDEPCFSFHNPWPPVIPRQNFHFR
jgi:hypothetical protein